MKMEVIHADGEWWINTAAFRMVDPSTNIFFEPGIKYQVRPTDWMQNQPVLLKTTPTDEEVLQLLQDPNETKPMTDLLEQYRTDNGQALAQVEATPEAIAAAEAAVKAQSAPAPEPAPAPTEPTAADPAPAKAKK